MSPTKLIVEKFVEKKIKNSIASRKSNLDTPPEGLLVVQSVRTGDLHVVPAVDYEMHVAEQNCWCNCYVDKKSFNEYLNGYSVHIVFHHRWMQNKNNQM